MIWDLTRSLTTARYRSPGSRSADSLSAPRVLPARRCFRTGLAASWLATASFALAAFACSPNPATVTQGTARGTGCAQQDLVVFNYDNKARTWLAACQNRVFVCASSGKAATCTQQDPESIDPALTERIEVLAQVPTPQRNLFVNYDMSAQDWDGFAKTVAGVARLHPNQAENIADPALLYTEFSPEFDAALSHCIGSNAVARIDVSSSGGLTVSPNRPCLTALRGDSALVPLRARAGQSFYLAAGVRGIEPMPRPTVQEPEPEPTVSPLELALRDWLDESAASVLACTKTDQVVIAVQVDVEGNPSVSLQEEPEEEAAEGCVRSALAERTFEGGPGEVVHLVRTPEKSDPDTEESPNSGVAAPQGAGKAADPSSDR